MEEILEEYGREDCISDVTGYVTDENKVIVNWEWPDNESYNLCVIYAVEDENEPLSQTLAKGVKPVIYPNQFNVSHQDIITGTSARFRLYPARKEGTKLYIVNQKRGNLTERFVRKTRLYYDVMYGKAGLISRYKTGRIQIRHDLEVTGDAYICYRCVGGMKDNLIYGIDLASFKERYEFEILLEKNETIEVFLTDDQKSYIDLVHK